MITELHTISFLFGALSAALIVGIVYIIDYLMIRRLKK